MHNSRSSEMVYLTIQLVNDFVQRKSIKCDMMVWSSPRAKKLPPHRGTLLEAPYRRHVFMPFGFTRDSKNVSFGPFVKGKTITHFVWTPM